MFTVLTMLGYCILLIVLYYIIRNISFVPALWFILLLLFPSVIYTTEWCSTRLYSRPNFAFEVKGNGKNNHNKG